MCSKIPKRYSKESKPITREELKTLIRENTFVDIGKQFNVSDNALENGAKFLICLLLVSR